MGDAVTEASTAIGPRRIGDLWRLLASGSFASTALELLGVGLMVNGLRLVYVPAAWLFGGFACFAVSFALERARARHTNVTEPNEASHERTEHPCASECSAT